MSLLKLKAKVKLDSEEDMEIKGQYDLGTIAKSAEWVWRTMAVPYEQVYKIVEFNKSKTIVHLHDDEMILVAEPFEDIYKKWSDLRAEFDGFLDPDKGEVNEEGESKSDDTNG